MALFRDGVDVPPLMVQQLTAGAAPASAGRRRRSDGGARRRDAVPPAEDRRPRRRCGHGRRRIDGRAALDDRRIRKPRRAPPAEPTCRRARSISTSSTRPTRPRTGNATSATISRSASIAGAPRSLALCRVLERWIAHFLGVAVTIEPKREIDDKRWVWHVGLDAEASGLLNDLYNRVDVDAERMGRLLCLFELSFTNPADMRPAIAGRPVYLAMAMDPQSRLKLKPQNLLLNLPLARTQ